MKTATEDVDRSIRPGKWVKRGPQPEAPPKPVNPLVSINNLVKRIREATDPGEKSALEAQYEAECKAFDAINPGSRPLEIGEVYSEIASTLSPFGTPIPATIGKDEWQRYHRQILLCRRSANQWLSNSRRFAAEKWGQSYVEQAEQQMELALGFEPKEDDHAKLDRGQRIPPVTSWAKPLTAWVAAIRPRVAGMTSEEAEEVREAIGKVEAALDEIRAELA